MPKYREIFIKKEARIIIWKITEHEDDLVEYLTSKIHLDEVKSRKSICSRKQFLATRIILKNEGLDKELLKDVNGKPHLADNYISISHDTDYVAVMISIKPCGIDLQSISDKVKRVKHKFIDKQDFLPKDSEIHALTIAWCIKEALYKINGDPMVYFKEHLRIVDMADHIIHSRILHPDYLKDVTLELRKIDDLYLTYTT